MWALIKNGIKLLIIIGIIGSLLEACGFIKKSPSQTTPTTTKAETSVDQETRKKAAAEAEAKRKAEEEAKNRANLETAMEHGINAMVFWYTAVNQPKAHQFASLRQKLPFQGSPTPKELKETKYIYAKEDPKFIGKNPYVITSGSSDKGFLYYGETKDNKPHGVGMLAKFDIDYPYPIYIGNFRNGLYDGYGILYERPTTPPPGREYMSMSFVKYEGEFEKGEFSGKGNKYSLSHFAQFKEYPGVYVPSVQLSSGVFDDGEMNGKFYQYLMDEITFEGNYKNGKKDGDGIEYYPEGKIKYKGEFKNGKRDGEGTLYEKDGTVKYTGKWKNGDYAH